MRALVARRDRVFGRRATNAVPRLRLFAKIVRRGYAERPIAG